MSNPLWCIESNLNKTVSLSQYLPMLLYKRVPLKHFKRYRQIKITPISVKQEMNGSIDLIMEALIGLSLSYLLDNQYLDCLGFLTFSHHCSESKSHRWSLSVFIYLFYFSSFLLLLLCCIAPM